MKGSPVQVRASALRVNVEATIRNALRSRSSLELSYEGDRGRSRTVHPQILYFDRNDTLFVDCWQLRGPSRSGHPLPGWRAFELAKIRGVEAGSDQIEPAPGLDFKAGKYARILARV
jgi:predicted DNA-binding transcriptional regulator YafY